MNRLAIFDCEATLADSRHNICAAMEECFAAAGLERPARERTRAVVGPSLVEAMRAMLPGATAIGALRGDHDAAELTQAGAHHLAAHPRDILALTKALA